MDLKGKRGSNLKFAIKYWLPNKTGPIDLTGYTIKMVIKRSEDDDYVLYEANTTNAIEVDAPNGFITVNIPADPISKLRFKNPYYQVVITNGHDTEVLLDGKIEL